MGKNKNKNFQVRGVRTEEGNFQIELPQDSSRYVKYIAMGAVGFVALQFMPAVVALVGNIILAGVAITAVGAGVMLYKNKDVRRGLKYWAKSTGKTIAERVLRIDPLKMAEMILETRRDKYDDIGKNIRDLEDNLATVGSEIVHNEEQIKTKRLYIEQANTENKPHLTDALIIEVSELITMNEFLHQNKEQIENALVSLRKIEDAAKFQLDRTSAQFMQMKSKAKIITSTHAALTSAHSVIYGDQESSELDKSLKEWKDEMAIKVSDINRLATKSSTFVETVELERNVQTKLAMQKIGIEKQLAESNEESVVVEKGMEVGVQ